ncbi:nitronate monooxygenase [Rapidithrix thailandica]|uniref:Propionate 3-nitronate monooxygenase n=1 Tax=Rapidithrix thailandica TaxID=413964 RepID=A0AAW9S6Q4_9BACT
MWHKTKASQSLGIKYPIIQGPFGGKFSSPRLLAAVSNAGGMGSFGLNAYTPEEILEIDREIKTLTRNPYALNLWVPWVKDPVENFRQEEYENLKKLFQPYFDKLQVPLPEMPEMTKNPDFERQMEAVFNARPPVMSFIFGIPPKEVILELKKAGIPSIATATTLEEAQLIEEAGMDLVIASGAEAGGHRASFLKPAEDSLHPTFSLLTQVAEKVKIPVIAAGGISDGKRAFEALQLGASAVQIGTAFLATDESNASQEHKNRLQSKEPFQTALTKVFTGRLARAMANTLSHDFENCEKGLAPYPLQSTFLAPLRKAAIEKQQWDLVAFWSGQPSSVLTHRSAEQLFEALVHEITLAMGEK